ncbi:LOW QUALITY PROTEIN: mitogen-activated protein kinase kinase kinase 19-like [Menidia menidia]
MTGTSMTDSLQHINIVGFLGTSLNHHVVFIFMKFITGGSIASILHRFGTLPERALLYTHQILEGVTYLHLNRVIHRDIEGNNVMFVPTGVIKLIDFCVCLFLVSACRCFYRFSPGFVCSIILLFVFVSVCLQVLPWVCPR